VKTTRTVQFGNSRFVKNNHIWRDMDDGLIWTCCFCHNKVVFNEVCRGNMITEDRADLYRCECDMNRGARIIIGLDFR